MLIYKYNIQNIIFYNKLNGVTIMEQAIAYKN